MITLKKILVPLDFSESSRKAALYGASFGRQYQARVILLSVVDDRVFEEVSFYDETTFMGYAENELRETRKKGLIDKIDQLIEEIKGKYGELEMERVVLFGIPYMEIVQFAREEEIDMIVMGSQGTARIKHFLLGSTTEKVIRKAPCPVLTVSHAEREFIEPESE
jgi:nucleotide-binding universal stress UspA family protein